MRYFLLLCAISLLETQAMEWQGYDPLTGGPSLSSSAPSFPSRSAFERKDEGKIGKVSSRDPMLRIEQMIADDGAGAKIRPNHSKSLQSILIDSRIKQRVSTQREFLLQIQAWNYIAHGVASNKISLLRQSLISKYTTASLFENLSMTARHFLNSLIAFNYLFARVPNRGPIPTQGKAGTPGVEELAQELYDTANIDKSYSKRFFKKIEATLSKIEKEQKTDKFDLSEIVPHSQSLSLQGRYDPRDYSTTQRLVTFTFNKDNNVVGCVNPTMNEFNTNPFAIYRRPVPTLYGGTRGNYAKDYLRINNVPPFLYLILLTDGDTSMVYGLPNPAILIDQITSEEIVVGAHRIKEKPGKLVQLSRGDPTDNILERVANVEQYLTNNNYMLPPVQLMSQDLEAPLMAGELLTFEHHEAAEGKGGMIGAQPKVCLSGVYTPMLDFLTNEDNRVFIPSEKIGGSGRDMPVPAQEIVFLKDDNAKISSVDEVDVSISYFKNKQISADYTRMYNGEIAWPKFVLIKSAKADQAATTLELTDLYVTQVLYRYNPETGTLIQESMGVPEPSITWRKMTLEDAIKKGKIVL